MHESTEKSPRPDAVARRRRMYRRRAARRLSQLVIASVPVFMLATILRPVAPASTAVTVGTDSASADAPRSLRLRPALNKLSLLAAQPMWRPAGDVLKRGKTTEAAPLPFFGTHTATEYRQSFARWHRIYTFSAQYRIKADLARRIYDAAVTAGIEPELGFRLVRVESVFDPRAVSSAGALGLTQLMPGTARLFEPNVTRAELLTPDVNLRIGFRYLRGLIREYKGDLKLALLVYNRGPIAVDRALSLGQSPSNGYESIVTKGYRGNGTLE